MVRERDLKSAQQPINWSARAVFRSIYLWASSLLSGCLASIKSSPENPISYKSGLKQPVTESCRHLCFSLHLLPHPRPDQTSFHLLLPFLWAPVWLWLITAIAQPLCRWSCWRRRRCQRLLCLNHDLWNISVNSFFFGCVVFTNGLVVICQWG